MTTQPKTIAGLHCFDVLEHLDDYVDAALPDDVLARVEAHLAQCDACTAFGGRYAGLVATLHAQLSAPRVPPPEAETSPGDLARALFRKSRGDEG
jgi:anti-sigma factor RsiW